MASENHDPLTHSLALPAEVEDWIDDTAAERGESRDVVCRRLLTAAHAAATGVDFDPASHADTADVESLEETVEAQRAEFTDLLEDVRSRVIQVKLEADKKAATDHDHPALEDELETLKQSVTAIEDDLGSLERTVNAGLANIERTVEENSEHVATIEERSVVLAKAVLDLRDRRNELAERLRRRAETDELKRAANQLGVQTAICEDCGSSVDIALLGVPQCPHCESQFAAVESKSSFFGSNTLRTGDPPALEGHVERAVSVPNSSVFETVAADAQSPADETAGEKKR